MIALVRPPCGWSIGFIATPLTLDLQPKDLQKPDLVELKRLLFLRETEPIAAKEYIEKNFLTPDGNVNKAVCFNKLNLIILAETPALLAYWTPEPGYNSIKEIRENNLIRKIVARDGDMYSLRIDLIENKGDETIEKFLKEFVDCK